MANQPAPAIRTTLDERHSDIELRKRIGSNTRHYRGLGDVGTVVELVDMSDSKYGGCPRCNEPTMVLSKDIGPEGVNGAFYCTNIECPHFVQDAVETDMSRIRADRPAVWDNTAECPNCEKRFTTERQRTGHRDENYVQGDADGGIVEEMCTDCHPHKSHTDEATEISDAEPNGDCE